MDKNVRKICNRYQAAIKVQGKTIHIGMYESGESAYAAVEKYKKDNKVFNIPGTKCLPQNKK